MTVAQAKIEILNEKKILWLYNTANEALQYTLPTVKNIYNMWSRRKAARGIETVMCEREEIIQIARVLKQNRLEVEQTFKTGLTQDEWEEAARRAVILHKRYDFSVGQISKGLEIPPDAAANMVEKKISRPSNQKKYLKIVMERKEE